MSDTPMDLTIIIVNWNTRELLCKCLDSIYSCIENLSYDVFVVDNASTDGSVEAVRRNFSQVKLIVNQENNGFARANNQVLTHVSARYALLLNSDTEVIPGAIETLVAFMDQHPEAAVAAPQYLNPDGTKQNSFENFPGLISELLNKSLLKIIFPQKYPSKRKDYHDPLPVDSVIGAAMMVRTEAMKKVGCLDEDYFFFLEETDWCYRMRRAGYEVFHIPRARIYHIQGASKKKAPALAWIEYYRSSYLFFKKNKSGLSWLVFRLFRPVKLGINLLLTSLAVMLTFARNERLRRKWSVYFQLCRWHLKLCPDNMGLRPDDSLWYQDFTNCAVLKESKLKKLLHCPVDSAIPHKSCLIKIYLYPGLWQTIKYCFLKSKAHKELALARQIRAKGIPTIIPEKVKDIRKQGFLRKSVVLTEYLPDCMNLEELLLKTQVPDRRLKRKIIDEYGRLARLIHDQGIYQEDFDPNNILYQKKQDAAFQLYFIDFEKTRIVGNFPFRKRVYSLAKLNRMGRRLSRTDQMRFLSAYLGPRATRGEKREWVTGIRREEDNVLSRDQRRARRQCTRPGNKIGCVTYAGYRGYYRKRHHSRKYYTGSDIIHLVKTIEENFPDGAFKEPSPNQWLDITARLDGREETFQVRFFEYGGFAYRLPGAIRRTPLIAAWRNDNSYLKNRSAGFMPVAALEKRTARNRYRGYLIRKN